MSEFVEHEIGHSPIILTAPHDGSLRPSHIPDRKKGRRKADLCTSEIACGIRDEFDDQCKPHLIVMKLHRSKIDVNREKAKAADEQIPDTQRAYTAYHDAIKRSIDLALKEFGFALLLDIHGQAHRKNYFELGYLLGKDALRCTNNEQFEALCKGSSMRNLLGLRRLNVNVKGEVQQLSQVVRGVNSFGSLLEEKGYNCIPSRSNPHACYTLDDHICNEDCKFWSGGFTTRQYSKLPGVCTLQIETPVECRFSLQNFEPLDEEIRSTSQAIAQTCKEFLEIHFSKI